jgi:hypothetical protein
MMTKPMMAARATADAYNVSDSDFFIPTILINVGWA